MVEIPDLTEDGTVGAAPEVGGCAGLLSEGIGDISKGVLGRIGRDDAVPNKKEKEIV